MTMVFPDVLVQTVRHFVCTNNSCHPTLVCTYVRTYVHIHEVCLLRCTVHAFVISSHYTYVHACASLSLSPVRGQVMMVCVVSLTCVG